ncbi:MAG: hypothetical protein H6712_22105 [Myxococcales bacterium]|nr:hypothetical protein [Myxococcales bacterium]MCB9716568.1 hypothetical protein [Myxococcales bacterium]
MDYEAIDRALLQPRLPRWRAARAAVAGVRGGHAAWEAATTAGLVPASWAEPGRRTFMRGGGGAERERPIPASADEVARVVAASAIIEAVEALARELVAALEPWGQAAPRRIAWSLLPAGRLRQSWIRSRHAVCEALALAGLHASNAAFAALGSGASAGARLSALRSRSAAQRIFAHDAVMHEDWQRVVAAGVVVSRGPFGWIREGLGEPRAMLVPEPLVGRPFAALPDPMSPLLAIWAAGCALGSLSEARMVLHLGAPAGFEPMNG